MPIGKVLPFENNPRINKAAVSAVAKSIAEFGFRQPIVVDEKCVVIIGHTRLKAAQELKMKTVPVHVATLPADKVRALRIADNKLHELAEWNDDLLRGEIEALQAVDFDLDVLGFEDDELHRILNFGKPQEEEKVPLVQEEAITQSGWLYELGEHRLLCGDAAKPEDVARLLAGAQPDMMLTDPPYNVAYVGKTKEALEIQNDKMNREAYVSFLVATLGNTFEALRPGAAVYIWHADSEGLAVRMACETFAFRVRQCLVWAKNVMVMGRQDYQWQHEPCLYGWKETHESAVYGWKDGAAHEWNADRCQTTVLKFDRPTSSQDHPTMKPVELFEYLILNSSKRGEVIVDPFGGSGTTIVAAERCGRKAALMEIDPRYCDVIVRRWESYTGKKVIVRKNAE